MIIGTDKRMTVGRTYSGGLVDGNREWTNTPVRVLREATFDDWVAWCIAGGNPPTERDLAAARQPTCYFYEVTSAN
jgi:hypothetical protein